MNPEPSCSFSLHSQPVVFDLLGLEHVIYIYEQFNFYNTKILFFVPFSPRRENECGRRDVKRTSRDTFVVEYGLCGGILVNCVVPHSFQSTTLSYDNTITVFCVFPDVFIHRRTQVGCVSLQISKMSDE